MSPSDAAAPITAPEPEKIYWTQEELLTEAKHRFGEDPWSWKFQCPRCGDIACAKDFKDAGVPPAMIAIGQECIGRHLGALSGKKPTLDAGRSLASRGCDWCAYGLFRGPWLVEKPDGKEVGSFRLAPADERPNVQVDDPKGQGLPTCTGDQRDFAP